MLTSPPQFLMKFDYRRPNIRFKYDINCSYFVIIKVMNFPRVDLSMFNGKNRIPTIAFVVTLTLLVLLGIKLFSIERSNVSFNALFAETRDKIKLLSSEVGSIEKKITKEKAQDDETKIQLFSKLSKRLKELERQVQEGDSFKKSFGGKPKSEMTLTERIEDLEDTIREQSVMLDLLENNAKEIVRHTKNAKFDELVKGQYFQPQKKRNPWMMQRANIKTPFIDSLQRQQIEEQLKKEETRLEQIYHYSEYKTEIPFCIVVPSFNNAKNFRYQYNLQSIFNQDYSNYRVVIVDDASSDNTTALIKHFLKRNKKLADKVVLITNKKQMTAVPNIHLAITKHCKSNEIGFFVDGDDELVGRKVFKVFNAIYQRKKPAVAYSISLEYWVYDNFIKDGWSKPYSDEEKAKNLYRDVPQKISHLRSFRIDLYLQVKQRDLKDVNGEWFTSTYDEVICLPMLEMSCGNIQYIDDFFYLYVYGTGYNDRLVDSSLQWSIANYVKTKMPKYECDKRYAKIA